MRLVLFFSVLMLHNFVFAMVSNEPCEAALEKKATFKFLIVKLSKNRHSDTSLALNEINRVSRDYRELNSLCKR